MSMTLKQLSRVQPVIKLYRRRDFEKSKAKILKLTKLELVLCLTNTYEVHLMDRSEKIKFEDFIINCLNR